MWIDDDPTATTEARDWLLRSGHDVQSSTDAADGVLRARRSTFHLIILGIRHPALDTIGALRELRRVGLTTPMLVLSKHRDIRLAFEVGRLGADLFECRPLSGDGLVAAIQRALAAGTDDRSRPSFKFMAADQPRRPLSERLAHVVVAASLHPTDWRSLRTLAAIVGVGYGTLRAWCHSAGVCDRSFNRFCRVFRAVRLASRTGSRPADLLDVIEPIRMQMIFRDAGIDEGEHRLGTYRERQTFLSSETCIAQMALSLVKDRLPAATYRAEYSN